MSTLRRRCINAGSLVGPSSGDATLFFQLLRLRHPPGKELQLSHFNKQVPNCIACSIAG
jgi:hypothetical protein